MVTTTTVAELDLQKTKPLRAGILPYARINDDLCFCFGVDTRTLELTDFGGGIVYRKDKNAVNGAIREFKEESLGVFELPAIESAPVIFNKRTLIILVEIEIDPVKLREEFRNRLVGLENPEVSDLAWISRSDFLDLVQSMNEGRGQIYRRIRDLLRETDLYLNHL